MNTYYVYYEKMNQDSQDYICTDTVEMKAANLDSLRKRLAKDVLKRTNSRYMYTAIVMKDLREGSIGDVMPYSKDVAVWEPSDDKHRDEGAYYPISLATGKLGKKRSWFRWHPR